MGNRVPTDSWVLIQLILAIFLRWNRLVQFTYFPKDKELPTYQNKITD